MSLPDQSKPAQNNSSQPQTEAAQQGTKSGKDERQKAIEQEADTARLRSERKSVEDGSDNESGQ